MKRLLLILIAFAFSQVSFGQGEGKNAPATDGPSPCPPGMCMHWEASIKVLNFHKPRTDCKFGFGFCLKFGGGTGSCVPCGNFKNSSICKIQNGEATCYVEIKNNKLELHLPAGIKDEASFTKEDMSTFTVEKGTFTVSANGKEKTNKEGSYPVVLSGTEYIVLIDIE
jgi:hypothetical protein